MLHRDILRMVNVTGVILVIATAVFTLLRMAS
jgi:hypothetical protein